MEVFWEKGYEGTSLDDLQAAMGGISPPSFYAAFGSKERLFYEVVERYATTVGCKPVQALEAGPRAREGVEAMLREAAGIFCSPDMPPGCVVMLGAINCAPANKSVQDYLRSFRLRVPDILRKRLERGVAEGDIPEGTALEPIVSFYSTLFLGLPLRARDGASRDELLMAVAGAMAAWDQLIEPAMSKKQEITM
jgi:AcrR family transcriptional regulator